ncbi:DEAD/DEAH box helicase [Halobacteriovorax vibrionivorans]|uniref:DEAD/DEAH box helicase n=1 Tax=Halobacteriovorax vibrionivorans TaxID=2152716 RepID=A0ABY0IJY1_9BACT|nr:DEAD/DEAH box helicase [Halobacteriovorax vibrionivorans]TGD46001.1 DEAD/DEAH box helicase [Halobacteriovorax sp. Y22]
MNSFDSLKLLPEILSSLNKKGYKKPTPIQAQSIPHLLTGGDILGIAQTGTGKTAAFSLPILNNLGSNKIKTKPRHMRTLILTPTRELASQINENIEEYGKGLGIKSTVIFGGVKPRPQILQLKKGMDVIVATPGRFLDLMSNDQIQFGQLETFVLDEADRMLDMGFIRDVNKIIARLPKKRQTLLFSATMPQDIVNLSKKLLVKPKKVEVTPESTTVEKIDQKINFVHKTNKPKLLINILEDQSIEHVLVFTKTKHGANRVVKHLDQVGITSAAIHGNKSQGAREKALGGFKKGTIRVLVATDIAARGIDVSHITHVINYNLPDDPKSYVHRIGRTARAGRDGIAISFCDDTEKKLLKDIEKTIKYQIPQDKDHPFHGVAGAPAQPQNHRRPSKKASANKSRNGNNQQRSARRRPAKKKPTT